MAGLPAFDTFTDAHIAAIANHCRVTWGEQPGDVDAARVVDCRAAAELRPVSNRAEEGAVMSQTPVPGSCCGRPSLPYPSGTALATPAHKLRSRP